MASNSLLESYVHVVYKNKKIDWKNFFCKIFFRSTKISKFQYFFTFFSIFHFSFYRNLIYFFRFGNFEDWSARNQQISTFFWKKCIVLVRGDIAWLFKIISRWFDEVQVRAHGGLICHPMEIDVRSFVWNRLWGWKKIGCFNKSRKALRIYLNIICWNTLKKTSHESA